MRARLAILLAAGSAALGGCTYGYGGYGPFGGLSVGVGYSSGYGGYDPFCSGYGYGYGGYYGYPGYGYGGYPYGSYGRCIDPYWGWYDGFYYPGTGYYVYDSYRRPHVWTDAQRRYWSERRKKAESAAPTKVVNQPNWGEFNRQRAEQRDAWLGSREDRRVERQSSPRTRSEDRQVERSTARERASDRRIERRTEREIRRSARDD